jgi:hypothetical protein
MAVLVDVIAGVAHEGRVVGAFAAWRPLLCERSLAVGVGIYRRAGGSCALGVERTRY